MPAATKPFLKNILIGLLAVSFIGCNQIHVAKTDHDLLTNTIRNKADSMLKSNPIGSMAYFLRAFASINNPSPADEYVKFSYLQRYHSFITHQNDMALLYADSGITVLENATPDVKITMLLAQAKLNKGDLYFDLKQYNNAYLAYYNARKIAYGLPDDCTQSDFLAELYTRIANINFGEARFKEAINWFNRSARALSVCTPNFNSGYLLQGKLDNIALCYGRMGMPDSAQYYYDKALAVVNGLKPATDVQRRDSAIARGVILGNKGSALFDEQKYTEAKAYFLENININSKPGYATGDALITRIKLADAYLALKQLKAAEAVLNEIDASADTLTTTDYKLQLLLTRAKYFKQTADYNKASKLFDAFIDQFFVMRRQNAQMINSDLKGRFELIESNFKIAEMERMDDRKTQIVFFATALAIIGLAIGYTIFKKNKKINLYAAQATRHNRQLESLVEAYEKSNSENDRLLRVVAHDLKNPIGAIYGLSNLILDDSALAGDDLETIKLIRTSSENLNAIIDDLLSARNNRQTTPMAKTAVDIGALLTESVDLLQYRANEKQQQILLTCTHSQTLMLNRDRIWRVINNLIVNAIKFSAPGTSIHVACQTIAAELIVSIKDEGIGIPDEFKDSLFDLSTKNNRKGTLGEETHGLGLFISKEIVEEHGGRIWFQSVAGQGSVFYFSLPLGER